MSTRGNGSPPLRNDASERNDLSVRGSANEHSGSPVRSSASERGGLRAALSFAMLVAALAAPVLAGCGGAKTSSVVPAKGTVEWRYRSNQRLATDGRDTSRITLDYPAFTRAPSPATLDSLNAWVRDAILRPFDAETTVADTNQVLDGFLNAWREERRDPLANSLGWDLDRTIEVVGDTLGTLSMRLTEYVFTGGAHPNTTITQVAFDLATGRLLEFGDVFRAAARDSFDAAVDPLFRHAKELAPGADLAAEGFEFPNGRFRLNENFSSGSAGATFIFNAYEIAPYVMGGTMVVVPWEIARPFLRRDRPPGRFLDR